MQCGVVVHNRGATGTREIMVRLAQRADRLGFHSVWVTDHLVLPTQSRSRYLYSAAGG